MPGSCNSHHVTDIHDTVCDRLGILTWPRCAWRGPCGLGAPGKGRGMLCVPRSEQAAPPMREDPGELTIDSSAWLPYRPYGSLRDGVVCTCKGFGITAVVGAAVLLHRCQISFAAYYMVKAASLPVCKGKATKVLAFTPVMHAMLQARRQAFSRPSAHSACRQGQENTAHQRGRGCFWEALVEVVLHE